MFEATNTNGGPVKLGLFVNTQWFPWQTDHDVLELAKREIELADALGLYDVWVGEHHFLKFGLCGSALAMAAFALGHTRNLRIGTAVTLTPHQNPLHLAEQVNLLDHLSDGRLDFGIGRGGSLAEYEVLGTPLERWETEVEGTVRTLLDVWRAGSSVNGWSVNPKPLSQPYPPFFVASRTRSTVQLAARERLPLLHFWARSVEDRRAVQAMYDEAALDAAPVEHVHSLLAVPAKDTHAARETITANLVHSFTVGDVPHVPQLEQMRHGGPTNPQLAVAAAQRALIAPPAELAEQISAFIEATGARRLMFFLEPVGSPEAVLEAIETIATEVGPLLQTQARPV